MASLTRKFEQAIATPSRPPAEDQDALAPLILAEFDDTRRWDASLADPRSATLLERLAAEPLAEEEAGRTGPLEKLLKEVGTRRAPTRP